MIEGTKEEQRSKTLMQTMDIKRLKSDESTMSNDEQLELLRSQVELKSHPNTNVPEIKQVELFTKWRRIVPQQYWHLTCPMPTRVADTKIRAKKNGKQRGKNAAKRGAKKAPVPRQLQKQWKTAEEQKKRNLVS